MNGPSHAQAQRLILAALDGLLDEAERVQLEAHLAACETCRAYQAELSQLETAIRQTGQSRLENLTVPPAARLNIQSTYRKNLMKLRTINVVKGLAALAVLALVAFGLMLLIPQMKQVGQIVTPTAPMIQQPTSAPTLETTLDTVLVPADRLVAYASSESGNSEIYLTRTAGGPQVDITNNPAYDANPVWSPNGRQIAFESERDGNREIYVMDFDGNNVVRLTNDPANDVLSTDQVWSPDGTHILYKNDRAGKWDLFAIKVDGSGTLQLTQNSDSNPEYYAWSPDSQKVAYVTGWSINNPQLHLVNTDGSGNQLVPLDRMPYSFSLVGWAADSQSVYYSGSVCSGSGDGCLPLSNRLYQISLDNPKPVVVAASGPTEARRWVIEPERIIYLIDQNEFMSTTNRGYDHWVWWQVINKNATKLNEWPNLQEKCQEPDVANLQIYLSASASSALIGENLPDMVVAVYCGKDDRTWLYRFSPDGSQITLLNQTALVGQVDLPRLSADGEVLLYDLYDQQQLVGSYALNVPAAASDPATAPVRLAATNAQAQPVPFAEALSVDPTPVTTSTPTAQNPAQFPAKDLIVFVRSEGTTSALYVMQKDGSDQRRLTKTEIGSIFYPQWSPDGTQILFEGWDGSSGSLYLIGLDGTLTKLAEASGPAAWSPDGMRIAYMTQDELRVIGLDNKTIASAPLSEFTGETDYWTLLTLSWTTDGRAVQTLRTNNQGSYPLDKNDRWWVYEMNATTGEVRTVVTSELPIVTWHGDLVIKRNEKSWQWQRNGKVISTATPGNCATLISGPTSIGTNWSPDGRWVLFAVDCYGQGNPDLYVARADGSDLRLVVKGARTDWWRPIGWSPDARYIIFGADLDSPGNYDIYSLDLKTPDAKPVRLTHSGFSELSPIWFPLTE